MSENFSRASVDSSYRKEKSLLQSAKIDFLFVCINFNLLISMNSFVEVKSVDKREQLKRFK